jgi:hypothetical protein
MSYRLDQTALADGAARPIFVHGALHQIASISARHPFIG